MTFPRMKCLYSAKYLVSADVAPCEDGALLVRDETIAAVGRRSDLLRANPGVDSVDFPDALLVPLLVNAHTHLELTGFPEWAEQAGEGDDPTGFVDWILRLIRVKRKLERDNYRNALLNGLEQSLAAGTGAVGDILAHHAARDAYPGSPLSGRLYLETLGQDPAMITRLKQGLDEVLTEGSAGELQLGISPHSPYTIRTSYLKEIYARCRKEKLYCSTHLAESPEEVTFVEQGRGDLAGRFYPSIGWEDYVPRGSGLRPVAYLREVGGLFPQNLLVHGVQLNDAEIAILAEQRMHLALCPRSNAQLKVGRAPAGKLRKAGVGLALGTDSLASCPSLSIWDEMAFAHAWFGGELDAPTLFRMATLGGAQALGLDRQLGTLQPGRLAGFQVLQPKSTVAVSELFDYFVTPGCQNDLVQVYHRGRPRLSGLAEAGRLEPESMKPLAADRTSH